MTRHPSPLFLAFLPAVVAVVSPIVACSGGDTITNGTAKTNASPFDGGVDDGGERASTSPDAAPYDDDAGPEDAGQDAATACDPTGVWGVKASIGVTWPQSASTAAGSGTVSGYFVVDREGAMAGGYTDGVTLCGVTFPAFAGNDGSAAKGFKWAATIDATSHATSPAVTSTSDPIAAGARYATTSPFVALLGPTLADPAKDPWPNPISIPADAGPGDDDYPATTFTSSGANPFVTSISAGVKETDLLYGALRVGFTLAGAYDDCNTIKGTATPASQTLDTDVLACKYASPATGFCTPTEATFLDGEFPKPNAATPGTFAEVRLGGTGATVLCSTVIASLDALK